MKALPIFLSAFIGLIPSCSTNKSVLKDYIQGDRKTKWSLICEKDSVSQEEYNQYLATQSLIGNSLTNWRVEKIEEAPSAKSQTQYAVVAADIANEKKKEWGFSVNKNDGRSCVQFAYGARLLNAVASDYINSPLTTSVAFLPLKLSDYYNYNVRDLSSQFYSTTMVSLGDTGFESSPNIYIRKLDDPSGEIFKALRTGNAYVKGVLALYTDVEGISFPAMEDYKRQALSQELFSLQGKIRMKGGDSSIMFLHSPTLVKPQYNNSPE